jgi:hypothetical protein
MHDTAKVILRQNSRQEKSLNKNIIKTLNTQPAEAHENMEKEVLILGRDPFIYTSIPSPTFSKKTIDKIIFWIFKAPSLTSNC